MIAHGYYNNRYTRSHVEKELINPTGFIRIFSTGDIMFSYMLKKIFGSKNERYIKQKLKKVMEINALEPEMQALSDEALIEKLHEYKKLVISGESSLDAVLVPVFAIVREAAKRVLGMRHFDVQMVGGMVLHNGKIAEMKTGEGKTLMATLPVVLNALTGKGVHVVTVNDYLAKRDAESMGQLYNFLGLSVGVIVHGISDEERKAAYTADVTYGTNNEFGFDYLRDNMKFYKEQLAQRDHFFAIVDEVDSILIDEARTPLIISGAADDSTDLYSAIDSLVVKLQPEKDFTVDEKAKTAMLTDEGVSHCEQLLGIDNLFDMQHIQLQHHVQQSLKAHSVFHKDVDYIVKDGQVVIVDEFTGRIMPGRRFSDGLHQALEAKEHVKVEAENQTLASITFQNYFRLYDKLSGMTGTADTEAVEFHEIYGLEVISVPTHRPMIRRDMPDVIYRTKEEKYDAIVKQIEELYQKGQPVLVGTISIETSELLSTRLKKAGVPHNVLNAKHHEQEAMIIADAGQRGHVTIATNMAGRGTDITLGEGVRDLGGLFILGTERHESRRIDNQLRGRSGRQGDPGCSRFFLCLEDDLMRLFGSDRISKLMATLGLKDGESIEHRMISRSIENAQKRVEGHHFEIRKALLDYDNVMNQQREVIYSLRRETIEQPNTEDTILEFLDDCIADVYAPYTASQGRLTADQQSDLLARLQDIFTIDRVWKSEDLPTPTQAKEAVLSMLQEIKETAPDAYENILRYFLLEELDRCWKEHLFNMDHLRDGIGLRGYGQRDPKQEYKREGFTLFQEMIYHIHENIFKSLTRVRIQINEQPEEHAEQHEQRELAQNEQEKTSKRENALGNDSFKHKERNSKLSYSGSGSDAPAAKTTARRSTPKVGRNDECPCGSGKKYKNCCGK